MPSISPLALMLFQITVAVLMFGGVNWLGKHSPMFGYESVTMFTEREDSVAFNFFFRVITPIVMLLFVAAACYVAGLDGLTKNLHFSIFYYLVFRVLFNVVRGRALILPWRRLMLQWAFTVAIAFVAYEQLISKRENLLPDPATIANEVWLAVAGYLYVLAGQVFSGDTGQEARGGRYVTSRRRAIERRFASELALVGGARWRLLVLAVLIVEDFNRPAVARFAERVLFRLNAAKTLGIMQVTTDRLISDAESIGMGTKFLQRAFAEAAATDEWRIRDAGWPRDTLIAREESHLIHQTLVRYNPSGDYARDVLAVYEKLIATSPETAGPSLHPDVS